MRNRAGSCTDTEYSDSDCQFPWAARLVNKDRQLHRDSLSVRTPDIYIITFVPDSETRGSGSGSGFTTGITCPSNLEFTAYKFTLFLPPVMSRVIKEPMNQHRRLLCHRYFVSGYDTKYLRDNRSLSRLPSSFAGRHQALNIMKQFPAPWL